jgi:hypothetical protein
VQLRCARMWSKTRGMSDLGRPSGWEDLPVNARPSWARETGRPGSASSSSASVHRRQSDDRFGGYRESPRRDAGWALGFMPLAVLVAQYGLTFLLARELQPSRLHTSGAATSLFGFASGAAFSLIGLAFLVIGPVIVYIGTQDIVLTLCYLGVRWLEGYLLSFVLTAALLS